MNASFQEIVRRYLRKELTLDELRDWLVFNQWDLFEEDQQLADEVDVALIHLDDGYGEEQDLRIRLSMALDRFSMSFAYLELSLERWDLITIAPASCDSTTTSTFDSEPVLILN